MPHVTDGAFAASKEFIAGFWNVETKTADEAYRRITGSNKKAPIPDHKRDEKAIVETMVEMENLEDGAQPPPWMRGRDPIDRAFEEVE